MGLALCFAPKKKEAKSIAGFSQNPAILFAMFCRGSRSDTAGVDMVPCCCVPNSFNQEAGIFFTRKSTIRPTSRISLKPLQSIPASTILETTMSDSIEIHPYKGITYWKSFGHDFWHNLGLHNMWYGSEAMKGDERLLSGQEKERENVLLVAPHRWGGLYLPRLKLTRKAYTRLE